jgi:NADPH-dependent 2,4-dienoyl-CoA reductase/sulfur reductase-like enzyme
VNATGGKLRFPGVVGTAISRICAREVALTGLTEAAARDEGFDVIAETVTSGTRAGYFPGGGDVHVKLVAERRGGRLLGAQIVGGDGAAMRINACAVAVTAGLTVEQVAQLDLAYAPPFASVWDPLLVAARDALKQI